MYNDWRKDMGDSVRALDAIRDTVLPKIITGKIHSIENSDKEILILMDALSGIDYIREDDKGLQGIAARVQWGNNWDTFTIRSERHTGNKTELQKRQEQIDQGYFYPYFTLQAYFDNRQDNNLLSIGIIRTIDLYEFMAFYPEKVHGRKSDNCFLYVKWCDLGNRIRTYHSKSGAVTG